MDRAHQYDGQMDKVEHERALNGPVYEIFRQHNFGEIEKHLTDLRTLTGPCYDLEARNHKFCEIDKKFADLKNKLTYPVYDIDNKHNYTEGNREKPQKKELNYPVYQIENQHNFKEFEKLLTDLKDLHGPVYNIENSHKFAEIESKVNYL